MSKVKAPARRAHQVHSLASHCALCWREGAELNTECPGYKTAAEHVEWKERQQKSKLKAKGRKT